MRELSMGCLSLGHICVHLLLVCVLCLRPERPDQPAAECHTSKARADSSCWPCK